jgi:hypothetical protein
LIVYWPVDPTFLIQWQPSRISRLDNTPTRACALLRTHSVILPFLPLDQRRSRRSLPQRLPQPQECLLQSQTHQISRMQFAILSPSTTTLAINQSEVKRWRKCSFSMVSFIRIPHRIFSFRPVPNNSRSSGRRSQSEDSAYVTEKPRSNGKPRNKKSSQHADVIDRLDFTGVGPSMSFTLQILFSLTRC